MAEEKTEKVKIGRNIVHENVMYGKGEYMVTPSVARALRAKNATASVATHMATEKERERARELAEAEAAEADAAREKEGGGDPSKSGVIIGGGSKAEGAGGESSPSKSGVIIGGGSKPEGSGGGASAVESLKGELPDDFPKRAELAKGAPDADPPISPVTRYEQLIPLTKEQLDSIPGIGEASVDLIGQRLFADAAKLTEGGGQ